MKTTHRIIAFTLVLLTLSSCFNNGEEDGRILVNNRDKNLLGRVIKTKEEIQLRSLAGLLGKTAIASVPKDFRLILRAEVNPPEYEGFTLRATHVTLNNDMAYVTYNREGADYLGGVEIFDISDIENPVLVSQAIFKDTDISSVAYGNNNLYLAGATNIDINPEFKSPAIVEKIGLNLLGELTTNSEVSDVSSYVATDVALFGEYVLTTSGSDGHLTTLDKTDMLKLDSNAVNDARSVAANDQYIAAFGASPATLYVLSLSSPDAISEYIIGGETQAESKSTIAIDGNYAYVAMNDGGLKVVDLTNGSILQEIDKPVAPDSMDVNDFVTNAVTVNEELVFIANGAAGVYVGKKYGDTEIEMYGSADLNSSTNYVTSNNNVLFVATGFGGFQILEIQHSEFETEYNITEGKADFAYQYGGAKYNFANTYTKEHYLGLGDLSIRRDRVDANYTWSVPGSHNIRFEYDPLTHNLSSTINGDESVRTFLGTVPAYELNALEFSITERSTNASIVLKNLKLNGEELGTYEGDGIKTWTLKNIDFSNDFVLTAIIELDGSFSRTDEKDKIEIFIGQIDESDTSVEEWVSNGQSYEIDDIVQYNGQQYICIQAHTTNGDMNWAPDTALSLWSPVV